MSREPDLDDSWVVEGVTWVLYLGWMTGLVYVLWWFRVPPMLELTRACGGGTQGMVGAIATGVGFLVVSQVLYNRLRRTEDDGEGSS